MTEVALLSFTTMGIQLYRPYMHSAKAENSRPDGRETVVSTSLPSSASPTHLTQEQTENSVIK